MAEFFFFCVRLHANTTLAANEFLYLPRTASFRHTQDGARRMQAQTNKREIYIGTLVLGANSKTQLKPLRGPPSTAKKKYENLALHDATG